MFLCIQIFGPSNSNIKIATQRQPGGNSREFQINETIQITHAFSFRENDIFCTPAFFMLGQIVPILCFIYAFVMSLTSEFWIRKYLFNTAIVWFKNPFLQKLFSWTSHVGRDQKIPKNQGDKCLLKHLSFHYFFRHNLKVKHV